MKMAEVSFVERSENEDAMRLTESDAELSSDLEESATYGLLARAGDACETEDRLSQK